MCQHHRKVASGNTGASLAKPKEREQHERQEDI